MKLKSKQEQSVSEEIDHPQLITISEESEIKDVAEMRDEMQDNVEII